MKLLKGKKIADKILSEIKSNIKKEKLHPALAVVLVGDDKASLIYVNLKKKAAYKIGISFQLHKFSVNVKEAEIIKKIKKLNADEKISGIIIQLPLPKKLNAQKIINAIDPKKDADGFLAKSPVPSAFSRAIIKMLEAVPKARLSERKKCVIIANSEKFREVMRAALKIKKIKANYVLLNNYKKNLQTIKQADILITAVGSPSFIKANMIKKGAIIIDGGIAKKGKKVLGDVDCESVKNIAGYISPVPGGVGPVTVACLLENVCLAAKNQK